MRSATLLLLLLFSLTSYSQTEWRGELKLNDSTVVPFRFLLDENVFSLLSPGDTLITTEISKRNDSTLVKMPVFGSELIFKNKVDELAGYFINTTRAIPTSVPFTAGKHLYRFFDRPEKTFVDVSGRYDVYFQNESPQSAHAVGIFKQNGNYVSGTFLTTTGDYRFLEGDMSGDRIFLSAFDGSHVYSFNAQAKGDSLINGHFYSSITWHDRWIARKNDTAALPSAEDLIRFDTTPVSFQFRTTDNVIVSPQDPSYRNKPMIIQLMGSWCPNCMDETKFLVDWINSTKNKIDIVALDFERVTDSVKIAQAIERIKIQLHVPYPIVYAGNADKKIAARSIPQLDRIFAFPTLIFLDREKRIVAAHSGFSGPATGEAHEEFRNWFEINVQQLLKN